MKNSIRFKLLIPILLFVVIWESAFAQYSEKTWDYPIKPGSKEWLSKSDFIERLSLLNIPDDTIKSMSTDKLLNTCLEYPYFGLIFTRNSLQQGYEFIKNNFNGFRELENRRDAGHLILKKYENMDPAGVSDQSSHLKASQYMAQFTFIEILLAQDSILFKLNDETKNEILNTTLEKFNQKATKHNYGIVGLSTTALIIAKIIDKYDDNNLELNLKEKSSIKEFTKSCIVEDSEFFKLILKTSEKYLK
ncbi:MAG: hypothetical protein WCS03_12055 [Bacteroidota bacterium]